MAQILSLTNLFRGAFRDLMRRPPGNIASLDVLRSMAILLVFSTHFGNEFLAQPAAAKSRIFYYAWYYGWTGVDLFFVLSGLLIGTQLWKEIQRTGGIRIGAFLLRRGLRIWPLYFFLIALMWAEVIFAGRPASGLAADSLFVSNYFAGQIGGSWSLATEEQFYILAPVCISLLAFKFRPRHLWLLPLASLLVPVISRGLALRSHLTEVDLEQRLYFPIHTHSDGLAIGMLLAWFVVFRPDLVASARVRSAGSAGMFALGVGLYLFNRIWFNFTALGLLYGAVTWYGMALFSTPRILQWNGFYPISRLSYGVYLNHFGLLPRIHSLFGTWPAGGGGAQFWTCYLVSFLMCLAFAAITFQLVEWPFLQIRSRWSHLRRRCAVS